MLSALRVSTSNIFIKGLLCFIAVIFVFWGIGDVLRGQKQGVMATVGKETVSEQEYQSALKMEVNKLKQYFGEGIELEQLQAMGITHMVLKQLLDRKLLEAELVKRNLHLSETTLAEDIRRNPAFHDATDRFDKEQFELMLASNHISERDYISLLEKDILIRLLLNSYTAFEPTATPLAKALYEYQTEARTVELYTLKLSPTDIKVPEATEEQLHAYYTAYPDAYTLPATRSFHYLFIGNDNLQAPPGVRSEELRELYDQSSYLYQRPEERTFAHLQFASEKEAKEAARLLAEGVKADDVVQVLTPLRAKEIYKGPVTKAQLSESMAEHVFGMEVGEPARIFETEEGWNLTHLTGLAPKIDISFEEIEERLKIELVALKQSEQLVRLIGEIEDQLAEGKKLSDIATTFDLPLQTMASIDQMGTPKDPKTPLAQELSPSIIEQVFTTPMGQVSPLIVLEDQHTHALIEPLTEQPETLQPFDVVKKDVQQAWISEEKEKALQHKADAMMAAMKDPDTGKLTLDPALIKKEKTVTVQRFSSESGQSEAALPFALHQRAFNLKVAEVSERYQNDRGQFQLIRVTDTTHTPANTNEGAYRAFNQELSQSLRNDIITSYLSYLHGKYPVKLIRQP